ncbi:MAG TPA: O-methyltransferase [Opitutaceae bacterium]|jgi:predicted O-methyltransferase YrrM
MDETPWAAVDRYIAEHQIPSDPALESALADGVAAGLPAINVSPTQGKFLHLLTRIQQARNVLEIGTLAGYSTIWMARALPPGGRLVSLEIDPKHAAIARANLTRAGLDSSVDLRLGKALDILPQLAAERLGPFDLIFIDADKAGIPDYFTWALRLSRLGTVIVVDNVVRKGGVTDASSTDPGIQGVRRFNDMLNSEKRVSATTLQTVGIKGYDGFTLALVTSGPGPIP